MDSGVMVAIVERKLSSDIAFSDNTGEVLGVDHLKHIGVRHTPIKHVFHLCFEGFLEFFETLIFALLSSVSTLGKSKALKAKERMEEVNPLIQVNPVHGRFTTENGRDILKGHHVAVDALDNIDSRLNLQELCSEIKIPLVHGAIAGWYGQVTGSLLRKKFLHIDLFSQDYTVIDLRSR
jgi:hypothetical protein